MHEMYKFQHVKIANKWFQVYCKLRVHSGYKALLISSPCNLAKSLKRTSEKFKLSCKMSTEIGHDNSLLAMLCRYLHVNINISRSKDIALLRDNCITSFFLQYSSSDQQSSLKGLPLGQLGLLNTAAIDDTTTTRLTFAS